MDNNKNKNKNNKNILYFLENFGQYKAGQSYEKGKIKGISNYQLKNITTDNEEEMKAYLAKKSQNVDEEIDKNESITEETLMLADDKELPEPERPSINVIEVPDEETKNKIVAEALKKGQKYIDDANDYFDLTKEQANGILTKANEIVDNKVKEATAAKQKALDEREKGIEALEKKAKENARTEIETEYQTKFNALKEGNSDLENKLKKYLEDLTKLDVEKISYKSALEEQFKAEYQELNNLKENLENTVNQLNLNIKKLENEKRSIKEDNDFLEAELNDLKKAKQDAKQLELDVSEWKTKYENLEKTYTKKLNEISTLNTKLLEYGNDPSQAIKEKEKLEVENKKLKDLLSDMPSEDELNNLRTASKQLKDLQLDYSKLAAEKADLFTKNIKYDAMATDLDNYKRFIRILEAQKSELENELKRNAELYNNRAAKVFANLSEIDKKGEKTNYPDNPSITLKELCVKFRGYLAFRDDKQKLYYDEDIIRTFIAGFASARLTILEGLSGTGKSSLPRAFMDFIGAHTIEVPVQSSWKDRNDLLGFYNDFKKQYKETEFLKALYRATSDENGIYLIVLDEMNLSRIEYYFADFLSVLEKDPNKWEIELISDYASINTDEKAWPLKVHEGKLNVLKNTWFIGTANKDDSTFMITDKVYDRSVVMEFQKKGEIGKPSAEYKYYDPIYLNNEDFQRLMRSATRISDNDKKTYKELINYLDDQVRSLFDITFGNRIENQLDLFVPCYINCGGTYQEAVDIMFSKKVLRKLEGKYDDQTKTALIMFVEDLDNKKISALLPRTITTLKKMIEKI